MANERQIQQRKPSNSTPTPATGIFKPRPFAVPAEPQVVTAPELQTKAESGQVGESRLSRIDVSPSPPIQPKLTIGAPDDKYEQEADTIARKVVKQINTPTLPDQNGGGDSVQRQMFSTPSIMRLTVQRREAIEGGAASSDLESTISQARSSGMPLGEPICRQMEGAFSSDFSGVRVHTNNTADTLNRSLNARAFTTGNNIFFKKGEYNPSNSTGKELLAHELTHVVQQGGSQITNPSLPSEETALQGKTQLNSAILQKQTQSKNSIHRPVIAQVPIVQPKAETSLNGVLQRNFFTSVWDKVKEVGSDISNNLGLTSGDDKYDGKNSIDNAVEDLHEAMFGKTMGWGTDEAKIIRVLEKASSPENIASIQKKYLEKYQRTLEYDIRDELSGQDLEKALSHLRKSASIEQEKTDEEKEAEVILAVNPKGINQAANDLYKAMDGWGTDEKKIMETLRGKSKAEIKAIQKVYLDHYGISLEWHLKDELSGKDLEEAITLLQADSVKSAAKGLENSLSFWGDDTAKIEQVLMGLTRQEIEKLKQEHSDIKNKVLRSLSGVNKEVVIALLDGNKPRAIALRLNEAMKGWGTDEEKVKKYLHGKSKEELKKIDQEYESISGFKLSDSLKDEFSGADLKVVESLHGGDEYDQAAARIYEAAEGLGTNEQKIYNEFKGKTDQECQKIRNAYDKLFGLGSFQAMIQDEFSGVELKKVEQYSSKGALDPGFALYEAMAGAGTDEKSIKEVLGNKTKAEISNIEKEYAVYCNQEKQSKKAKRWLYNNLTGGLSGKLREDLASELDGRDWHEVKILLRGKPTTIAEKWAIIKTMYEFELGSGSNSFSRGFMTMAQDLGFGTSKLQLEKQYWRLNEMIAQDKTDQDPPSLTLKSGYTEADFEKVRDYTEVDVQSYQAAKSAIAQALQTGGTILVGIVVSFISGGLGAAPWLATALSTAIGGGAGIGLKYGIEGDAYGQQQIGIDVLIVAVSTALTASLGDVTQLAKKLEDIGNISTEFAKLAFESAIRGASVGTVTALLKEGLENDIWRDSFLDYFGILLEKGIKESATGILTGIAGTAPNLKKVKNLIEEVKKYKSSIAIAAVVSATGTIIIVPQKGGSY